jgi:hypothetical protein
MQVTNKILIFDDLVEGSLQNVMFSNLDLKALKEVDDGHRGHDAMQSENG